MSSPNRELESLLFTSALEHAWKRFNFRISSALQILNFYLVTQAILSGAFVGALTQGYQAAAACIGFGSSLASVAAFLGGYNQILDARRVMPHLQALENRMADLLNLPGISGTTRSAPVFKNISNSSLVAGVMFVVAAAGGVAAGVYALIV